MQLERSLSDLAIWRQFRGIPGDMRVSEDLSIRVCVQPLG
jgi:hypothetical protein